MRKRELSKKIYLILFVAVSLATFILFSYIYFSFKQITQPKGMKIKSSNSDKYYLNEDYKQSDPYITKNPNLSDMLLGPIISDLDPSLGNPDALITVVIFSDYLCEFCTKQEEIIMSLISEYKNDVRLIWKDYPETNANSPSWKTAIAARCAGEQGYYWDYHNALYRNEEVLDKNLFLKLAEDINLNISDFEICLTSDYIEQLINDNIEEANALDITGVPFIYINDQEMLGQASYEDLKRLVEIELRGNKN